MNPRRLVLAAAIVAVTVFGVGAWIYTSPVPITAVAAVTDLEAGGYVRPHSMILGKVDAPVTITEFFDPSCEACRAFYPYVKQIMERYPDGVRLVLRYAAFHKGSDEAVKILEAARLQDKFVPVLEALLARQPEWATHGEPNLDIAWEAAAAGGLDLAKAREDVKRPGMIGVLNADRADIETLGVTQTPTFFVNGKPLSDTSPQQLADTVASEVQSAMQ